MQDFYDAVIVLAVALFLFIPFLLMWIYQRKCDVEKFNELLKFGVETSGEIEKYQYIYRTGYFAHFTFNVGDRTINASIILQKLPMFGWRKKLLPNGSRVIVRYLANNPENAVIVEYKNYI